VGGKNGNRVKKLNRKITKKTRIKEWAVKDEREQVDDKNKRNGGRVREREKKAIRRQNWMKTEKSIKENGRKKKRWGRKVKGMQNEARKENAEESCRMQEYKRKERRNRREWKAG
jgi:hypothetical protein